MDELCTDRLISQVQAVSNIAHEMPGLKSKEQQDMFRGHLGMAVDYISAAGEVLRGNVGPEDKGKPPQAGPKHADKPAAGKPGQTGSKKD